MSAFDPHPPSPGPDVAPDRSTRTRRWPITVALTGAAMVLAAVMLTLTTGSPPSGAAAVAPSTTSNDASHRSNGPDAGTRRRGIIGTVTAIDGKTLTVDARPKRLARRGPSGNGESTAPGGSGAPERRGTTYSVTTTDTTKVVELTDGTVSDLAADDTVAVAGRSSSGTVAARRIVQIEREPGTDDRRGPDGSVEGGPGRPRNGTDHDGAHRRRHRLLGRLTFGTVTSKQGSEVTIRKASGDIVKVTTTADTTVLVTRQVDFSSISVGDTVRAIGRVSGTDVAATAVVVGAAAFGPGGRPGCPGPDGPPPSDH